MSYANSALDLIAHMPYFRGKGALVLCILRAFPNENLTARLPYGGRMAIGLDSLRQSVLPYWIGKYEPDVVRAFHQQLSQLQPNQAVFDIGANIGFYTVLAAGAFRQRGFGSIHSFEPNPLIFAELERNIALNHFTNVRARCEGMGDVASEMPLYVNKAAITYSSLRRTQDFFDEEIRVAVTTLDEYVKQSGVERVGLVKLDVEGAELLVLRGGHQVLERDHPALLYEEFERGYRQFGYSAAEIRTLLTDLDYTLFAIREDGRGMTEVTRHADDGAAYQNVLAVPSGRK